MEPLPIKCVVCGLVFNSPFDRNGQYTGISGIGFECPNCRWATVTTGIIHEGEFYPIARRLMDAIINAPDRFGALQEMVASLRSAAHATTAEEIKAVVDAPELSWLRQAFGPENPSAVYNQFVLLALLAFLSLLVSILSLRPSANEADPEIKQALFKFQKELSTLTPKNEGERPPAPKQLSGFMVTGYEMGGGKRIIFMQAESASSARVKATETGLKVDGVVECR